MAAHSLSSLLGREVLAMATGDNRVNIEDAEVIALALERMLGAVSTQLELLRDDAETAASKAKAA